MKKIRFSLSYTRNVRARPEQNTKKRKIPAAVPLFCVLYLIPESVDKMISRVAGLAPLKLTYIRGERRSLIEVRQIDVCGLQCPSVITESNYSWSCNRRFVATFDCVSREKETTVINCFVIAAPWERHLQNYSRLRHASVCARSIRDKQWVAKIARRFFVAFASHLIWTSLRERTSTVGKAFGWLKF